MKDIVNIKEIENIERLENEYDLQKASLLERQVRLMLDENPTLKPIRRKLRNLIIEYEARVWSDFENMSDSIGDISTIDTNTLIGEIIANYPKSTVVFQKYFGDGCFDCPGQSYESIDMACRIHNVDPQQFLKEIKEALSN